VDYYEREKFLFRLEDDLLLQGAGEVWMIGALTKSGILQELHAALAATVIIVRIENGALDKRAEPPEQHLRQFFAKLAKRKRAIEVIAKLSEPVVQLPEDKHVL
jgi:hypothetical protein